MTREKSDKLNLQLQELKMRLTNLEDIVIGLANQIYALQDELLAENEILHRKMGAK